MKILSKSKFIQGSLAQSQSLSNEIFARMQDSKSSALVDEKEAAQTTDALAPTVTDEPTALGGQSTQPNILKPTPTSKKKLSEIHKIQIHKENQKGHSGR